MIRHADLPLLVRLGLGHDRNSFRNLWILNSSQMQGRLLGMSAFGFGIDLQGMGLHIRMAVVTEMSQITMDSYNRDDNGRYRLSL
jgi:hypothetical protein